MECDNWYALSIRPEAKYESGERFLTYTEVVLICKYLGIAPADIAEEIAAHTEDVGILEPQPSKVGRLRKTYPSHLTI